MGERIRPTRSGLFAIELLIAVGVFSLCAAICVGLFVRAEVMSRDSAELNRAVSEARNAAESFKAAGGDLEETARLTGGELAGDTLFLQYDGGFELRLAPVREDGYIRAALTVMRTGTDTEILAWEIAVLEEAA